ncbi:FecR family protein [Mucilaginibacter arboris]|uniref:DUF4974 domain-containing protein n=1 Tax=Mucilaginibacter arboris TaxID=2682090 RepID=A0A7K1ST36_9SPHI|nr:FecR family protein [Mucilaginibacter arboris]MVN20476.1 DUF4974 domain-containing protein [Mucilaginibacter arboris]
MQQKEINSLIQKYLHHTASAKERERLLEWYRSSSLEEVEWLADEPDEEDLVKARMYNHIRQQTFSAEKPPVVSKAYFKLQWLQLAAAVLLVTLFISIFLFFSNSNNRFQAVIGKKHRSIIAPGTNKAVLTLADGSEIDLDVSRSGPIARQSNISITKTTAGEIIYTAQNPNPKTAGNTSVFNTITTPRGGKFKIELPDGTKVWLNAASSLKYPTQFTRKERKVELSGEGYFEVAKNKAIPFKVTTASSLKSGAGQEIEVLGTHFNINAYADEGAVKTTLLEGSVRVRPTGPKISANGSGEVVLKPGQQSVLKAQALVVENADTEETLAWKNGNFIFNNEALKSVMSKISRWYDVDVFYEKDFNNIRIGGSISQEKDLSAVLDLLQLTRKVKFKTEGRRVTVMP